MTDTQPIGSEDSSFNGELLLLCDPQGRVQAVSGSLNSEPPGDGNGLPELADLFAPESTGGRQLTRHLEAARSQIDYRAEWSASQGATELTVRLDSLVRDGLLFGFAILVSDRNDSMVRVPVFEGDALVSRQQWHDIKNHLGGLKLYATFLKRKLPLGDDQRTIEKMLNGIDGLIEYLRKIRRGDTR